MLGIITHYVIEFIPSSNYLVYAITLILALLIRSWSQGFSSKADRNLADKTFILIVTIVISSSIIKLTLMSCETGRILW